MRYRCARRRFTVTCLVFLIVYVILLNVWTYIFMSRQSVDGSNDHPFMYGLFGDLFGTDDTHGYNYTPVVIVAYMRSGSSFLGNVIQHDPNVFYVFEPLKQLEKDFFATMYDVFGTNLNFQKQRPSMMSKEESLNIYRAWFTCNTSALLSAPHRTFQNFFKHGLKTKEYTECIEGRTKYNNVTSDETCVRILQNLCLSSRVRLLKTIRTPIDWLYDLMLEFPTMKIIHLVRDPRAIANSLRGFEDCHPTVEENAFLKCIKYFCGRMDDDVTLFEMLSPLFPRRIFRVHYEYLASQPFSAFAQIFRKLGLTISDETYSYIYNITQAGYTPRNELDTVRADSNADIHEWRTKLSKASVYTVEALCTYSMRKLQYIT